MRARAGALQLETSATIRTTADSAIISARWEEVFSGGADAHEDVAVAGYRLVDALEFKHSR